MCKNFTVFQIPPPKKIQGKGQALTHGSAAAAAAAGSNRTTHAAALLVL